MSVERTKIEAAVHEGLDVLDHPEVVGLVKADPKLMEAIERLQYWQFGEHPDNFTSLIYLALQKGDPSNARKLKAGFPEEFIVHRLWQSCRSQDEFFKAFGVQIGEANLPPLTGTERHLIGEMQKALDEMVAAKSPNGERTLREAIEKAKTWRGFGATPFMKELGKL